MPPKCSGEIQPILARIHFILPIRTSVSPCIPSWTELSDCAGLMKWNLVHPWDLTMERPASRVSLIGSSTSPRKALDMSIPP